MDIDYRAWQFWLAASQALFNIMVAVWLWNNRKHQVTSDRVQKVEQRMEEAEKGLVSVKALMDLQPVLDRRMEEVQKSVSKIEGRIEGFGRALDLIQEYLINRGG